jgi:thiamine phosphate synthase YjbQ (UPF0047 family)
MIQLQVRTSDREEMLDITPAVRKAIRENGWSDGALLLYCPHTTGAVTVKKGNAQYPEGVN